MINVKKIANTAAKLIVTFLLIFLSGFTIIVLAYSIPMAPIADNVKKSAASFSLGENYPYVIAENINTRLDKYSDSLMLLTAGTDSGESNVVQAMKNKRYSLTDEYPVDTLIYVASGDTNKEFSYAAYGRYWHGYLAWIKPLLFFFDYDEILTIGIIFQIFLLLMVSTKLTRSGEANVVVALAVAYIVINPVAVMLSFMFSTCWMITLIAILLMNSEKIYNDKTDLYFFLTIGSLVSYADLMTYPMFVLSIMVSYDICHRHVSLKKLIAQIISWCCGFVGMWLSKWIIGTVITGDNIIEDALHQAEVRSSNVAGDTTINVLIEMKALFSKINKFTWIAIVVVCIVFIFMRVKDKDKFFEWKYALALLIPIAWYVATMNQSYWHSWFTYRALGGVIFAVCIAIAPTANILKEKMDDNRSFNST